MGLISDEAIAIFYWRNPSGRNMKMGSIQLLKEMSNSGDSWRVKATDA